MEGTCGWMAGPSVQGIVLRVQTGAEAGGTRLQLWLVGALQELHELGNDASLDDLLDGRVAL
jgi:hypothetical protein